MVEEQRFILDSFKFYLVLALWIHFVLKYNELQTLFSALLTLFMMGILFDLYKVIPNIINYCKISNYKYLNSYLYFVLEPILAIYVGIYISTYQKTNIPAEINYKFFIAVFIVIFFTIALETIRKTFDDLTNNLIKDLGNARISKALAILHKPVVIALWITLITFSILFMVPIIFFIFRSYIGSYYFENVYHTIILYLGNIIAFLTGYILCNLIMIAGLAYIPRLVKLVYKLLSSLRKYLHKLFR